MEFDSENTNNDILYVGFWRRVIATIIDIILFSSLAAVIKYIMTGDILSSDTKLLPISATFILGFVIIIYTMVKSGGTPGKATMSIKIVNENYEYLSVKQAMIRELPQEIYCMGYLLRLIFEDNWFVYLSISVALGLVGIISLADVITIIFNKRKRALHDYLAKSYVVEKEEFNEDENNDNSLSS